jgi:hypothetical protein
MCSGGQTERNATKAALDLVVGGERLPAQVAIFQSAAPGTEILDIRC